MLNFIRKVDKSLEKEKEQVYKRKTYVNQPQCFTKNTCQNLSSRINTGVVFLIFFHSSYILIFLGGYNPAGQSLTLNL